MLCLPGTAVAGTVPVLRVAVALVGLSEGPERNGVVVSTVLRRGRCVQMEGAFQIKLVG